jgi:hypothetical protein
LSLAFFAPEQSSTVSACSFISLFPSYFLFSFFSADSYGISFADACHLHFLSMCDLWTESKKIHTHRIDRREKKKRNSLFFCPDQQIPAAAAV